MPYHTTPVGPRYGFHTYRTPNPMAGLGAALGWALTFAIAAGLWQRFGPVVGDATSGGRTRAIAMTVDQFRVLREDRALWTFTYLLPGEERLVLHYGTVSPGGMATATYDRLTDGQPAFVCEVGPRIREPLFRVMGDSPSAFFAGLPGQSLGRYRSPEEWPHRPLFLLETPGVAGGERYVMACGGDPDDGELSPEEEQLQREVNALKRFVQAHAKRPDTSTNSTPRQRRPRSSPGSTAGTTSGLATDLGVRK